MEVNPYFVLLVSILTLVVFAGLLFGFWKLIKCILEISDKLKTIIIKRG
jgi:hypothetical protein